MENIKEKDVQYCTSCGAINKKNAVICEECNKKIILRHRPVVDFLKKRVKDEAAGEITEKLFGLIKDFLFKHLYGAVLTVSVVATTTVAVVTATPYIKKVEKAPFDIVQTVAKEEPAEEKTDVDPEYAEWCEGYAEYLMSHYVDRSDTVAWAHEGYTVHDDTLSLNEIYAERAIPGFNHQGAHEMMSVRIPIGIYHDGEPDSPRGVSEIQKCVEGSYKFGENVSSPLGQTLFAEGYEIMECNFAVSLHEGLERDGTLESEPVEKEEFRVLFVRNGDDWYIAEDVLVDRIKGESYDLYMKYGPNGYKDVEVG